LPGNADSMISVDSILSGISQAPGNGFLFAEEIQPVKCRSLYSIMVLLSLAYPVTGLRSSAARRGLTGRWEVLLHNNGQVHALVDRAIDVIDSCGRKGSDLLGTTSDLQVVQGWSA
jgi:hypothetical protein